MSATHPWQSGPTELIKYAIEHLHREGEFNQRIAFLLLDVGVETLFKTFLQLPEEVTGIKASFSERTKASEGNFHELVHGVKKTAGKRLDNVDLTHIQFYHGLRNKLYHQGNGVTVPPEKTKGYASLAVECLKALLDVDLSLVLSSKETEEQRRNEEKAKLEEFEKIRRELESQLDDLYETAILSLESVEPSLVMPSFRKQYEQWIEVFSEQFHLWSNKLSLEYRMKNIAFEGKYKPEEYDTLLEEIRPTLPNAFRDFVEKYDLDGDDVIAVIFSRDFEEALLNMANIALKIPIDPHTTYFNADFIIRQKTIDFEHIIPFLGLEDIDDPIPELIKQSKEVSKEIKKIREALRLNARGL